ncbi:flippase [Rhodocaloribacter litoris]|uniref:flippase n=1 Tax=Rhodocaloribacter litoris TaxID=2558931 RepID=UPI00141ED83C|nr:flippase [Rhodocaloribacter litoris]QXD15882.1 flippase [Rhodocaloribacter litoris]
MRSHILKNITWLGAASLAVKPFWIFFLVSLSPRLLGTYEYGVLSAALALATMAGSFSDLGMSQYTLREVARHPEHAGTFFSNFIPLRSTLLFAGILVAVIAAYLMHYTPDGLLAVVFAGFYWSMENLLYYVRVYFRAFEILRVEAISTVLEKAIVIACGTLMLWQTRQATWTLAGMATGMAFVTTVNLVWVARHLAPFRLRAFTFSFLRPTLPAMIPLGIAGFLTVFYTRTDLVMIEVMLGEVPTGQYAQAYRILQALGLIPFVVAYSALFPRLSATYQETNPSAFRRLLYQGLAGLGGTGMLTALALTWLAPFIIHLLVPDPGFAPAIQTLRILAWTFPFTCLSSLFYVAFISMNRHRLPILTLALATLLNIGANVLVIPRYGIDGAALVTVLSEVFITAVYATYYAFFMPWPAYSPRPFDTHL